MTDTLKILHVDDEVDFVEMAATFLERKNDRFDVKAVTDASEGLDQLTIEEFDCIVSDYDMPGRNGIQFLEAIREDYPNLPFILYTGKGSEEVASEAISAGVTDYLQKGSGTSQYTVLANRISNAVEQYRSRHAVETTEKKLSQLAEKTDDILFMFNEDWSELLFINSAYEDIWDGSIAELQEDPKRFLEFVHPEDQERLIHTMERISNGEENTIEYRVIRPDGEQRWIRAESQPIFDDEGTLSRIVGSARDITERKVREERLREEQQFVNSIFDALPDPLYAFDVEGYPIRWNKKFEEVSGYSSDEIEEMYVIEFIPEEEIETIATDLWTIFDERCSITADTAIKTKHGDCIPYELTGGPLEDADGNIRGMTGIGRDLTERKEHENRLKALNETAQELMTAKTRKQVAEIGVDAAREILSFDANAIHLYEDDQSGLVPIAQTDAGQELVSAPPTFTEGESIAWRVYDSGEPLALHDVPDDSDVYNSETPIQSELYLPIGEDGILLAGSPIPEVFDQHDLVLGEILTGNIATALEQVKQTEQLRTRERELTRQNERLDEFANVVSHDLRNPLNVAVGRIELAREECDSDHLGYVEEAHQRMNTLIDDLLTLPREGEQVSVMESVNLVELSQNCWQNVATADATLLMDIDQTIQADQSRLQQLLENLMRNAVQHNDEGVTVFVGELDDGFYVEDNGSGISEEDHDHVFDTGYSTVENGTGFGLSIVKQVADAHDWHIHITEGADGGARFEITGVEFVQ